ncbi:MAG: hypothetical protein WC352_02265 [Candidatus Omnitrophota bacterium]|jgi:hypothetical protein
MKRNLILACFSVIFALIFAEGVLRVLPSQPRAAKPAQGPKTDWVNVPERVWTEYHPQLGWYHMKNKKAVLPVGGREVEVHTNAAGFRGVREYETVKPAGTTRLLVLGDSFPFGFGVGDTESFPAVLEAEDPKREVLNLSVPGYGIDQMLVAWRILGALYQPDIVLIGIFPEDFWRCTRAFADSGHAKPYFFLSGDGRLELKNVPVPPQYQLNAGQFPELIRPRWLGRLLGHSVVYRLAQKGLTRLAKNLGLIDPDTETEWIVGRAILRTLVTEIRQRGARPVLFILPPDRWAQTQRKDSLLKSLYRFSRQEDVEMIDPTGAFYDAIRQSSLADYYIQGDGHWTPRGHRLAAQIIGRYFKWEVRSR